LAPEINIENLRCADRRTLARAITLLESTRADHRKQSEELIQAVMPFSGNSMRIGLTGVPGVGKSTLIEALGNHVINTGHKVAVLAVDPSSSLSGGSILGDKTRMPTLATSEKAFIRATPAGETLGGVARRTRESIILCEAAGFDTIIVETVGVGQSETLVSEMTDMFILMLLPGGGDELQGIKRGIMELADLVIVNKADKDLKSRAVLAAADIQQALGLIRPRHPAWQVPIITSSALEKTSIEEIWSAIEKFRKLLEVDDLLDSNRQRQAKNWLWVETRELLLATLKNDPGASALLDDLQQQVSDGKLPPTIAARRLVDEFVGQSGIDEI
jgi:LAO/AO transport system kinase